MGRRADERGRCRPCAGLTGWRLQNMPLTEIYRPHELASVLPMFGPVGLAGMRVLVETAGAGDA